jgi:hypothetical protein
MRLDRHQVAYLTQSRKERQEVVLFFGAKRLQSPCRAYGARDLAETLSAFASCVDGTLVASGLWEADDGRGLRLVYGFLLSAWMRPQP